MTICGGELQLKIGENIRLRADGRYEARYKKGRDENGKIIYGYCYGRTEEEAIEKRNFQLDKRSLKREMNLLILGAGIHGIEVAEIAKSLRIFNKIDFLDDGHSKGKQVLGKWCDYRKYLDEYPIAIVAVGGEKIRKSWTIKIQMAGFIVPTLIHPSAYISAGVPVGEGLVICAQPTIAAGAVIGRGCIVSSGARVPIKSIVPDWCYFDYDRVKHYSGNYDYLKVREENV